MKQMSDEDSRKVMERSAEKAERIQKLVQPVINVSMPGNEAAEWANAIALVAGSALGMLHKALNVPQFNDRRAVESLCKYVQMGMKIGRES